MSIDENNKEGRQVYFGELMQTQDDFEFFIQGKNYHRFL